MDTLEVTESADGFAAVGSVKIYSTTPPTTPPVETDKLGSEATTGSYSPPANLYQPSAYNASVVVDINTPQTPEHGSY